MFSPLGSAVGALGYSFWVQFVSERTVPHTANRRRNASPHDRKGERGRTQTHVVHCHLRLGSDKACRRGIIFVSESRRWSRENVATKFVIL